MKRIVLILSLFLGIFSAARAVDLNALEVKVQMNPSEVRNLLQRFERGDTTLTSNELQTLYYGYSFTPDYDPRESFDAAEEAFEKEEYEQCLAICEEGLKLNPVSLTLNLLAYGAAHKLSDKGGMGQTILLYAVRADQIATTILQSGTGTTAATPFYVISTDDMNRVMKSILGVDAILDRTTVGPVDALKINLPGSDRMHILYFNNTRQNAYNQAHPQLY